MRIRKMTQNTRDFNITDVVTDGGTALNEDTFNGLQDNVEDAINEETSRKKISKTFLAFHQPSVGSIGKLSAPGSSETITGHKWSEFDMVIVEVTSRIWGYARKNEIIVDTGNLSGSSMAPENLYTTVAPIFNSNELATMQYYFTNNDTITVYYNSDYEGDNHLYISRIYGVKIR